MRQLTFIILLVHSIAAFSQLEKGGVPVSWSTPGLEGGAVWYDLEMPNITALRTEDAAGFSTKNTAYRFSAPVEVPYNSDNSGRWYNLPGGDRIWRLGLRAANSTSLACVFDHWVVPSGGKVYFYNRAQTDYIGPYTSAALTSGEKLCTLPLSSSEIVVEYFEPFEQRGNGYLSLSAVNVGYRSPDVVPAEVNSTCLNTLNDDQKRSLEATTHSTVLMLVGEGSKIATGTLINNRRQDGSIYLLTATDALEGEPSNWIFVFNYLPGECSNSFSCWSKALYGATVLASDAFTGLSLLSLNQHPKNSWGAYFSGWSATTLQSDLYYSLQYGLGQSQNIAYSTSAPEPVIWNQHTSMAIDTWNFGSTFTGSVGSPLFNQEGLLEGVFIGGSNACDRQDNDYFGSFRNAWNTFSRFLSPGNNVFEMVQGEYTVFNESKDTKEDKRLTFFPNPAHDKINIANSTGSTILEAQLIGVNGGILKLYATAENGLSLEHIPAGCYVLRVFLSNGHVHQERIIKF